MDANQKDKILLSLSLVAFFTAMLAMIAPVGGFKDSMKLGVITCLLVLGVALVYTKPWKTD